MRVKIIAACFFSSFILIVSYVQCSGPGDSAATLPPVAKGWQTLGTADMTGKDYYGAKMAFDSTGTPWFAYSESETHKKYVMKWDGAAWVQVGEAIGSTNNYFNLILAIDPDSDTPYLACSHASNELFKFDGKDWIAVGEAPLTNPISSIAFLSGVPYLTLSDSSANKIEIRKLENAQWNLIGNQDVFTDYSSSILKFAEDQTPFVLAIRGKSASIYKFDGASWRSQCAVGPAPENNLHDLNFVVANNVPYMTYEYFTDEAKAINGIIKCADNTITSYPAQSKFIEGQILGISLAVEGAVPYVAYKDMLAMPKHEARLKKFENSQWVTQGEVFSSLNPEGITLAVRNGVAYVAFVETVDGGGPSTFKVMKYLP